MDVYTIYKENRGLIHKIAVKYSKTKEDVEDLEQEGFIALMKAAERFENDKGAPFSSYAYTAIERHMQRYINKNTTVLSGGIQRKADIAAYKKFKNKFYITFGKQPTYEDVAECLDIDTNQAKELDVYAYQSEAISLDKNMYDDEEDTIIGSIQDNTDIENEVIEATYKQQVYNALHSEVEALEEPQRDLIKSRYTDSYIRPIKDVCKELGLSERDAKSLHKKAINRLRKKCSSGILGEYADEYIYNTGLKNHNFHTTWMSSTEYTAMQRLEAMGY